MEIKLDEMVSQDKNKFLEEFLNKKIIKRLERYAFVIKRRMFWQGVRNGLPPGGRGEEDYVMIALMKIKIDEKWRENPKQMLKRLFDLIRDEIRNHARSWENRNMLSESFFEQNQDDDFIGHIPSKEQTPREIFNEKERFVAIHSLTVEVKKFVRLEDKILSKVLNCIETGESKRKIIAMTINVLPKDVTIATKRIKKYRRHFHREWEKIKRDY